MEKTFIIYGAYGYTGELITELAVQKGLKPILSGRSEVKLQQMAAAYDLEYVVADVENLSALDAAAERSALFLNCAGPFKRTIRPVLQYCLDKRLHYTDITGEIEVFETAARYDEKAKVRGIMILPGTGFDVVPSDCLAAYLKSRLPDATHLELAFKSGGGLSHGTATTMVENIGSGGAIRRDGVITKVPNAYRVKTFDFDKPGQMAATIPWGDVSTAFYSTRIPNVMVYISMSPKSVQGMKLGNYIGSILSVPFVNDLLKSRIKKGGPSAEVRAKSASYLYGEVTNEQGKKAAAKLKTLDGYTLTAETAVLIAEKILAGNFKPGFKTPSLAYGADLILEVRGSERQDM